jgi:hypothetical protein
LAASTVTLLNTTRAAELYTSRAEVATAAEPDAYLSVGDGALPLRFQQDGSLTKRAAAEVALDVNQPGFSPAFTAVPDAITTRIKGILQKSTKYALNVWYPAKYGAQAAQEYITLPDRAELTVRPPSLAGYGIATDIYAGTYDAAVTGMPMADAKAIALRLALSVAKAHKSNAGVNGWGMSFQTGLWSASAAFPALMFWADLTAAQKLLVTNMTTAEANFQLTAKVPYWRNRAGTELFPGNTKGEENAWVAIGLATGYVLDPANVNAEQWLNKLVEFSVSVAARPFDLTSRTIVNGSPLADILGGTNLNEDGTIVNHGGIHPDYMGSIAESLGLCVTLFAVKGLRMPQALVHNLDHVYRAFVDVTLTSPPYRAPGGTIYKADGTIYYPRTPDWGNIILDKASVDVQAIAFNYDKRASVKAPVWAALHLDAAAAMQARFTTGQMYADGTAGDAEYNYAGREQITQYCAATAMLASKVTATTAILPPTISNATPALIALQNRAI